MGVVATNSIRRGRGPTVLACDSRGDTYVVLRRMAHNDDRSNSGTARGRPRRSWQNPNSHHLFIALDVLEAALLSGKVGVSRLYYSGRGFRERHLLRVAKEHLVFHGSCPCRRARTVTPWLGRLDKPTGYSNLSTVGVTLSWQFDTWPQLCSSPLPVGFFWQTRVQSSEEGRVGRRPTCGHLGGRSPAQRLARPVFIEPCEVSSPRSSSTRHGFSIRLTA